MQLNRIHVIAIELHVNGGLITVNDMGMDIAGWPIHGSPTEFNRSSGEWKGDTKTGTKVLRVVFILRSHTTMMIIIIIVMTIRGFFKGNKNEKK